MNAFWNAWVLVGFALLDVLIRDPDLFQEHESEHRRQDQRPEPELGRRHERGDHDGTNEVEYREADPEPGVDENATRRLSAQAGPCIHLRRSEIRYVREVFGRHGSEVAEKPHALLELLALGIRNVHAAGRWSGRGRGGLGGVERGAQAVHGVRVRQRIDVLRTCLQRV